LWQNHNPYANAESVSTPRNTPIAIYILANDGDLDGDSFAITAVTNPAHGSVQIHNNGTPNNTMDDYAIYTPNYNYTGTDSFTYTITDSTGASATATVTITVTPPWIENPPPYVGPGQGGGKSGREGKDVVGMLVPPLKGTTIESQEDEATRRDDRLLSNDVPPLLDRQSSSQVETLLNQPPTDYFTLRAQESQGGFDESAYFDWPGNSWDSPKLR
jgi:VCBS repeat-containing protein